MFFKVVFDGSPPHRRDPQTHPHGLFLAWSLADGGAQGFYWFATRNHALVHLREIDVAVEELLFPPSTHPIRRAERMVRDSPLVRFWRYKTLENVPLAAINEAQCRVRVHWAGSFDELLTGTHRFAREVRRDFCAPWEQALPQPDLPPHMLAAFCRHLENYIDRFPERSYRSPFRLKTSGDPS